MLVAPYDDWNAIIEFKDTTVVIIDGTNIMFKYYLMVAKYNRAKSKSDVKAIYVKGFYYSIRFSGRAGLLRNLERDVYGPMGHEPIAFKREADARRFLKEHKTRQLGSAISPKAS